MLTPSFPDYTLMHARTGRTPEDPVVPTTTTVVVVARQPPPVVRRTAVGYRKSRRDSPRSSGPWFRHHYHGPKRINPPRRKGDIAPTDRPDHRTGRVPTGTGGEEGPTSHHPPWNHRSQNTTTVTTVAAPRSSDLTLLDHTKKNRKLKTHSENHP